MSTQEVRRRETRAALLEAGARLFAARGVADASVDAIAREAGRTSGALYDHFGSKEGLLFALLESWVDDVTVTVAAELVTAATLEERMTALWRAMAAPPVGDGGWIALEHELWSYAARHEEARSHLAERYRAAWEGVNEGVAEWGDPDIDPEVGPALIGVLLGLEMIHRVDPDAVTDEAAVAALCAVAAGAKKGTLR